MLKDVESSQEKSKKGSGKSCLQVRCRSEVQGITSFGQKRGKMGAAKNECKKKEGAQKTRTIKTKKRERGTEMRSAKDRPSKKQAAKKDEE